MRTAWQESDLMRTNPKNRIRKKNPQHFFHSISNIPPAHPFSTFQSICSIPLYFQHYNLKKILINFQHSPSPRPSGYADALFGYGVEAVPRFHRALPSGTERRLLLRKKIKCSRLILFLKKVIIDL
jgi:hypothetical protein